MTKRYSASWQQRAANPGMGGPASILEPPSGASGLVSGGLSYEEIIKSNGATWDPETGLTVRIVPRGSARPERRSDGKWYQARDKRFVARTMDEARSRSVAGQHWDYYCTGLKCPHPNCAEPMVGWVRDGMKFEREHSHIFAGRDGLPGFIEVDPPEDADEENPVEGV